MDEALQVLVGGRVEAARFNPETGLLALGVYCHGGARTLGVGVGPRVSGVGWLPRAPVFVAGSKHPLCAALKAHVVGHRVRSVERDDEGALWLAVGGEGLVARVRLAHSLQGEARVIGALGETVLTWKGDGAKHPRAVEVTGALEENGEALVGGSDRLAGELARETLARALRAHLKKLARRESAVRGDLARLEDVGRLQKIGRMLLGQGAGIPRGTTRATLLDWEEGGRIEVVLDPSRPAKAQAEGFFQKARRLARGEAVMRARLAEVARAREAVGAFEAALSGAEAVTPEGLAAWRATAKRLGVRDPEVERGGGAQGGRGASAPREPFIEYEGWKEHRVLVGRGPEDNDALTTRVARPHDLWLHARSRVGAHVVVPLTKGTSCPPELLVDAATLAAHHSDARGEPVVEVQYTERRYVRKPRKGAPGFVTLEREKVLTLRVEPERLARLLASRAE